MPISLKQASGASVGYRFKEIKTTSGTFTVPPNVFKLKIVAQGAGASGWGNGFDGGVDYSPNPLYSGAGGGAGAYVSIEIDVTPNDVVTYVVGAGGIATTYSSPQGTKPQGGSGGNTTVRIGNKPLLIAGGGIANPSPASSGTGGSGEANTICTPIELVRGGQAGEGRRSGSASGENGSAGNPPTIYSRFSTSEISGASQISGATNSTAGTGNTSTGARGGGGGGSSTYGRGGNGGNAEQLGEDAPATNYGAGGGGSGGFVSGINLAGKGANGCVEIWY
jgi:hypothetical protein